MELDQTPISQQETTINPEVPFQPDIKPSQEKPYTEKPKSKLVPILLGIVILILGGIYGMLIAKEKPTQTITPSEPTPTASSSITISQPLSALATTSAFLTVEQTIASLSSAITTLNVTDTTLNPPTIDLSLGLEVK